MQNPFEGLDVDKIKNAGLPTKLMLGGSIGFFIFGFFDWWSADISVKSPLIGGISRSSSANAFDLSQGTIAWLLMVAVGVLAILMLLKGPNKNFVIAALACSGLALLFTLWYWARIPSDSDLGVASALSGVSVDVGASFGLFIALILSIVATAGAFMTFQAFQQS